MKSPTRRFQCTQCGNIKDVIMNHDELGTIWERCTEECMWSSQGIPGPVLYSKEGEKTGFHKRIHRRIHEVQSEELVVGTICGKEGETLAESRRDIMEVPTA